MNAPKLRFKEFTDDYKKCKYKNVLKIKNGRDQKQVTCIDGKYPILGTGGVIGKTNNFLYNKPSVLIGRKGTIDKPQYMEIPFWTVDTLFYSEIFSNNFPKYIYYSFQNINWKKYDESTGVPSLNCSTIENIDCFIPDIKEQTKISNFLSLLDKKIELQTKKIEDLKLYKKGLDKFIFNNKFLFNKEEFALHFDSDGGTALEEYISENGTHKVISIGNYSPDGEYIDNNQRILLNDKTKTKLLNKNNLVMILNDKTTTGDIIGSTILIDKNNAYIYNQRSQKLICKNINPQYAWCFLNSHLFRKHVFKLSQGGTQIYINFSTLEKQSILIPKDDIIEKRIINSIIGIKNKITIENRKLDSLEKLKKGLMQNMFV